MKIIDIDKACRQLCDDYTFVLEILGDFIVECKMSDEKISTNLTKLKNTKDDLDILLMEIMKTVHNMISSAAYLCCEKMLQVLIEFKDIIYVNVLRLQLAGVITDFYLLENKYLDFIKCYNDLSSFLRFEKKMK
tara:strand:- start:333 stop:734 length:402 start_codon:yes stop_codon:yes gene_type:complete